MSVSKILTQGRLWYFKTTKKLTSNMVYIVALGVGFKCPRKIRLNTQCPPPPQKKKLPRIVKAISNFDIKHLFSARSIL